MVGPFVLFCIAGFFAYISYREGKESGRNDICRQLEWECGSLGDRIVDEERHLMDLLNRCDTSRAEFKHASDFLSYMKRKKRVIEWFLKYIRTQVTNKPSGAPEEMQFEDPEERCGWYISFKKELLNPKIFEDYKRLFASDSLHLKYIIAAQEGAVAEINYKNAVFDRMRVLAQIDTNDERECKYIKEKN